MYRLTADARVADLEAMFTCYNRLEADKEGYFQQYDLDGTYVGPVSAGSTNAIRDMAYDPTTGHMFGGAGANRWSMMLDMAI